MCSESPLFSIIIPVYNADNYIKRCVDSVLAQSFTDYELILVDDGSIDESGSICDEYSETHPQIKVIHKTNSGVSAARNHGIDKASGVYISFLDSDDEYYLDALMSYHDALSDACDGVLAGYTEHNMAGETIYEYCGPEFNRYDSIEEAINQVYLDSPYKFQGYVWNRLFRRDIITNYNIRFNEDIFYKEDGLFIVEYLCHCKQPIVYFSHPVYKYRINSSGAMGTYKSGVFNVRYLTNMDARIAMLHQIEETVGYRSSILLAQNAIASLYFHLRSVFVSLDFRDLKIEQGLFRSLLMNVPFPIVLRKFFGYRRRQLESFLRAGK